eukprot:TRINITY_DN9721_c0_g2_i2.p1 TRINITY_DN9721_c0_g2~~TRINITY_DN9721_c0_g2_i2.p1  ORF type:complete len:329 (+),score=64.85 TRINITY_DN9721_c0_g2_i2:62-988(+)
MPASRAKMQQEKPMIPGVVFPLTPGEQSVESSDAANPCSSPSSTATTTTPLSDAEQQQLRKQKELQQKLAQQKRQLYEKKFEEQHLNRPPRQPHLRHRGQTQSREARRLQGLAALQQKGQALLSALAHDTCCGAKDQKGHGAGELGFQHPVRDLDSHPAFIPGLRAACGQHIAHAAATASDGDMSPVILSSLPGQPALLPEQPDVRGPYALGSQPVLHPSFGVMPELPPCPAPADLPTLLSRCTPHIEKRWNPPMAVRPPPGLEAPRKVPESSDWLSQEDADRLATHGFEAEPRKIDLEALASLWAAL